MVKLLQYIIVGILCAVAGAFLQAYKDVQNYYLLPKTEWGCITHFIPNDVTQEKECWMYKNNKFIIYGPYNRRGSNNFPDRQSIQQAQ